MPTFQNYLKGIKAEIVEIDVAELKANLGNAELIDIREQNEYVQGFIQRAQWIPRGSLETKLENAASPFGLFSGQLTAL